MVPDETRIYVDNMPYTAIRADGEELFLDSGYKTLARMGPASCVRLPPISSFDFDMFNDISSLRNPSYCLFDLVTAEEAREAMKALSGVDLKGHPLKTKLYVQKRSQPDQLEVFNACRHSSHSQASEKSTRNSTEVVTTDKALAPTRKSRRVYLGNLPKLRS